jgi:hypothetical protein
VRLLLESGADPAFATASGTTPTTTAQQDLGEKDLDLGVSVEGRRECVAALEVRPCVPLYL